MEGFRKGGLRVRLSQSQAFPSWQSDGVFWRAAQSKAASKTEGSPWETVFGACAARQKTDGCSADGKAVRCDGILVLGGGLHS